MAITSDKILWDVMEEHLEEAGFLWTMWERALVAPDYTLDELAAREEQRLVAHLDALVQGGEPVVEELLVPALEQDEAEISVAAALALTAAGHGPRVLEALGAAAGLTPGVWGLRRALELSALDGVRGGLEELCAPGGSPLARALALEALAFHGVSAGVLPGELLSSEDPVVVRALLRAGRVAPGALPEEVTERGLASEDPALRDVALRTGILLGAESARRRCDELVQERVAGARAAMELVSLQSGPASVRSLEPSLASPELALDALWALGFCGSVEAAELCVTVLQGGDELLAAAAAEALCAITGLDLTATGLVKAPEPGLEEPDEEGGLVLATTAEESLLAPDVEQVCAWWEARRAKLSPGVRYIMGRPAELSAVAGALHCAPLWRRHGLALDLGARADRDRATRINTRTWCLVQRRRVHELAQLDDPALKINWGDR